MDDLCEPPLCLIRSRGLTAALLGYHRCSLVLVLLTCPLLRSRPQDGYRFLLVDAPGTSTEPFLFVSINVTDLVKARRDGASRVMFL